jgi:hypothetical protein
VDAVELVAVALFGGDNLYADLRQIEGIVCADVAARPAHDARSLNDFPFIIHSRR